MLFADLTEILDPEPHPAAWNMALDEALLLGSEGIGPALLRVYRWQNPAVSFGYFGKFAEVAAAWPGREFVRRWTGGGIVPHGEDLTYSLIVPKSHPFAKLGPLESYAAIHQALAGWLASAGIGATLSLGAAKISEECFANPAPHDVMSAAGKIAGAAQRRTRLGLLHQGSIQGVAGLEACRETVSGAFGKEVRHRTTTEPERAKTAELVAGKYGTTAWLDRW
jgi:lipoate-protein ligase A